MKAWAAHQGNQGETGPVLQAFRGRIHGMVKGAQEDPYAKNTAKHLSRVAPDFLAQLPAISFSGNEKNPLFHNRGDGTFEEIGSATGLSRPEDGRGFVLADLNRDGAPDVVIHNFLRNPFVVLRNDVHEKPASITVKLRGTKSNRFGIGARVWVDAEGCPPQMQEIACGTGFLSGNPPELTFAAPKTARIKIRWPTPGEKCLEQEFPDIPTRRIVTLTEGEAAPQLEEYRPVALGKPAPIPAPSFREGDAWPKEVALPDAKGPRVVVLFAFD